MPSHFISPRDRRFTLWLTALLFAIPMVGLLVSMLSQ
jgi:hypothetical protein